MKTMNFKNLVLGLLLAFGMAQVASAQCSVSFTASTSGGTVTFTNTSSGFGFMGSTVGVWSFGDGTSATTSGYNGTVHTYGPSVYSVVVCLTMTDSVGGCSGTYCDSVLVNNSGGLCSANFLAFDSTCQVAFNDFSFSGSGISSWSWDFGDGNTSTLQNPVHTYSANGNYTACLTIADTSGCTDSYCTNVAVTNCSGTPPCSASYAWMHDSTQAFTILLYPSFVLGNPATTTYLWTFGDGTSSTSPYPSHVYAGAGNYVVCVTISDNGCTATYCDTLPVLFKTNAPFSINVVGSMTANDPKATSLNYSVFPNPFSNVVNVNLALTEAAEVTYEMTDIAGRMIYSQHAGKLSAGNHTAEFRPAGLAPGMYLVKITAGEQTAVTRVIAR